MATQIQIRRDAAADWTSNDPILAEGEIGLETDTGLFKIGDGSTAWSSLGYKNDKLLDESGNIALDVGSSGALDAKGNSIDNQSTTFSNFNNISAADVYEKLLFSSGGMVNWPTGISNVIVGRINPSNTVYITRVEFRQQSSGGSSNTSMTLELYDETAASSLTSVNLNNLSTGNPIAQAGGAGNVIIARLSNSIGSEQPAEYKVYGRIE